MKRSLLLIVLSICTLANASAQIDIATARGMSLGSTVTIKGIITNGNELGVIRYIQDLTGGIAIYDVGLSAVNRGDSLLITGDLSDFNNLLEMDAASHTVLSTGNTLPAPQIITPLQMSESVESELVQIDDVVFDNGGATFAGNTNYGFVSGGETGEIRITGSTDIEGTLIPVSAVTVVALQSQYSTTYQLLPRDLLDITQSAVIFLTSSLGVSNITTTSVDFDWTTNISANTNIKYGLTTAFELGEVNDGASVSSHTITLPGLTAATFYYVQAYSVSGTDTAFSSTKMISTASNSSGQVIAVFNNTIDNSVATISPGTQMALMQDTIISMIQRAQSTIDVCVYNNNNINIVNALNAAYNSGVVVRYVTTIATLNQALTDTPIDPGIDVMKGNSDGIMHNKFMIIDVNDVDNSWVLSGSTNWTTNNLLFDFNNMIMIQDQAIAKAFTIEFEEMWGGSGTTSNFLLAKFGSQKSDNTPHEFNVGGNPMEVYFSPTDQTTAKIVEYMGTTDTTLEFCILSFTRNEVGTAVAAAYDNVTTGVRGVMESISDQGEEYTWLTGTVGVNLLSHQGVTYVIHHKYAVIDANMPASDPLVLTGSHNWSTAAETKNDENTVIIHDAEIANHFHQEFNRRHCELDPGCTLAPQISVAFFSITDNGGGAFDFTDLSSNSPTTWAWDFGDGNTSTAQNPSNAYATVDSTYSVCLTVSNGVGSDTYCANVSIKAPVAFFSVTNLGAGVANFTDMSSFSPTSWAWDFGDGNTSTAQNPSNTYAFADSTYNICLTATNAIGSNQYCMNVFIADSLVGINTIENKDMNVTTVYPNPSEGSFTVEYTLADNQDVMVKIYTLTGHTLYHEILNGVKGKNNVAFHTVLPPGLYLLEFNTGGKSSFTNIIIK